MAERTTSDPIGVQVTPTAPPIIPFRPDPERQRIQWPDNARLALLIIPNVEHYEYVPPVNPFRNPYPHAVTHPDVVAYSHRDYGNRVGFWRLLEVFDEFGVRPTVSLNVAVLDLYPEIRDVIIGRDWAILSHGLYNTRYLFGISPAEERAFYRETMDTVARHHGRQVKGMLGPSFTSSPNTSALMAEAGFTYQMDWFLDDQPFPISVPSGRLVGIPYSRELNDSFLFAGAPFYAFEARELDLYCRRQFDTLYEEGAAGGRVMTVALHPFLIGQPHRIDHLRRMLDYLLSKGGVWQATADEVADYYYDHYYDEAVSRLANAVSSTFPQAQDLT